MSDTTNREVKSELKKTSKEVTKEKTNSESKKIEMTAKSVEDKGKKITMGNIFDQIFAAYSTKENSADKNDACKLISDYLVQQVSIIPESANFNILTLYDTSIMIKSDADHIYNAINGFEVDTKPLLLILHSNGGDIGSAYLIGQLCREHSNGNFSVSIPRQAKSAATLLSCAADTIHMGSLSELGPIDPQIHNLPALGLKSSIEHIAQLVKKTPESAEMFAKYLHYSLKPIDLGYYERVAESAVQYAEKLLDTHKDKLANAITKIAYDLVYTYKDHSFVIDIKEAIAIFGDSTIKIGTVEYKIGNLIYKELSIIENLFSYLGYQFYLIGSLTSEPIIRKK